MHTSDCLKEANDKKLCKLYIFGAGERGQAIYDYLKNSTDIAGFLDSNKAKIDNKTVFPVEKADVENDYVIVSSIKYYEEMYTQLLDTGFNKHNICGCGCGEKDVLSFLRDNGMLKNGSPIVSSIEKIMKNNETLKNTDKLKVLLVRLAGGNQPFLNSILDHTDIKRIKVDVFQVTGDQRYGNCDFFFECDASFANSFLSMMGRYDVINFHSVHEAYYYIIDELRANAKTLIASMWGGDFYRVSPNSEAYRYIYKHCDYITATNSKTVEHFIERHGEKYRPKVRHMKFGDEYFSLLDKIIAEETAHESKLALGIPTDKIIITYGRSAVESHQHEDFIAQIKHIAKATKEKLFIVFMMTYPKGREDYIAFVSESMKETGVGYKIFDKYLNSEDICRIRRITDIHMNLLVTDTFGGAFQESLYAGNVCVSGSWLPYDEFIEYGCYYHTIDDFSEVVSKISCICNNLEAEKQKCLVNRCIGLVSNPETCAKRWQDLYFGRL